MHIHVQPDAAQKLTKMGDVTLYEPAGDAPQSENQSKRVPKNARNFADCISHVQTPTGAKPILKTMVTTACEKNCYYCPFRAGRGQTQRLTFKPDELAQVFDDMQRAKLVDGLFLSSGIIKGGVTTQDKIIDTVEIIRNRFQYRGYVHLKIMPGAERDQIYRAMQLADRVSINLEGPTQERLSALAPKKDFNDELVKMLQWAGEIKRNSPHRLASLVTQFVVGAVGDTDVELLTTSERLYRQVGLARAYYSAFSPVIETPFENLNRVAPQREFRLYQSSFLLRDYGWDVEDLPFVDAGNLRLDVDPKRAWADLNLRDRPVDVALADRMALLRVPGIGPAGADAILKARRTHKIRDLADLRKLGIRAPEQASPYILFQGRRPPQQLSLFDEAF
ncbi:MAG: radical SAM protein [Anaerolineaceae bacterium]|nr:radical SAM protein [Anaerolineaceae bacterium]